VWPQENSEEDRDLVRQCQEGDQSAFEKLVLKYQQTLFKIVCHSMGRRTDVEDVAQKILTKIYFSLNAFDNTRSFFPWMYRIAVNQCFDEMRRIRRRRLLTFSELNLEETECIEHLLRKEVPEEPPVENQKELQDLLHKMIERLPEKQRRALILRDLENVPYDKVAEILGCSEQAARLKVFRARTRLRTLVCKSLRRNSSKIR
jgi:RNA polymerase sigma-70 factor (ECF subfamily)